MKGHFEKGVVSWNKGMTGEKSHLFGRKHSPERIAKALASRKKFFDLYGRKTPKLETLRRTKKYKEWRKSVFERDNYTCQKCGARSKKGKRVELQADHIKQFAYYPELRFEVSNGRTLCGGCHRKTPTHGHYKKAIKI